MSKGYIDTLISWLILIFRKATFRLHKTFLTVLRLFRRCEVVSGGKERAFREHGLALSSQPSERVRLPTSVTLAVPPQSGGSQLGTSTQFLTPVPVDEGSDDVAFNTQHSQSLIASSTPSSMPEPSIPTDLPPEPAAPGQCPDITLTPIIPTEIKRYDRDVPVKDDYVEFEIKKGLSSYLEELRSAWLPLTHPEGALFFYHPDKRVFTDADVRDPQIAAKVDRAAEKAYEEARNAEVTLPLSVELGLELMEGNEMMGYYFADCDSRVIFWFEDIKSTSLMSNVRGVEHKSHVRYAIESQYWFVRLHWRHIELFPNKRFLPQDDVVRLKEIVTHVLAEIITSDTCLAPFGPDNVASMLSLMDPLMSSVDKDHEHSVCIVARFMRLFCNSKFVNFCGQPGARLDADQPLYGDPNARPKNMIIRVMNIILFGSPYAHSKVLHRIWVDETILQPRWKNFIDRLNGEWSGYTIFSTVMLAVDISFLAVPSVQNQTAATLASYLSTICAMGSLVVSLLLAGQVNDTRRDNAEGVALFMVQMTKSMLGLESLALMLSLPFALLIWGMIFFGVALSILMFHTSGVVTISIVSPLWATMVILATWPVLAANDIHLTSLRARILQWVIQNESPEFSSSHV